MIWKETLKEKLAEEAADRDKYLNLAEMAEKDGCRKAACIMRDIAYEESVHHKLITEMLEE